MAKDRGSRSGRNTLIYFPFLRHVAYSSSPSMGADGPSFAGPSPILVSSFLYSPILPFSHLPPIQIVPRIINLYCIDILDHLRLVLHRRMPHRETKKKKRREKKHQNITVAVFGSPIGHLLTYIPAYILHNRHRGVHGRTSTEWNYI
jgi:hypothetical protein